MTSVSEAWNLVPGVSLGFSNANDPANGMFTTANFPDASGTNLTDARAFYALLTGRVLSINATSRLDAATGEYVYLGNLEQIYSQQRLRRLRRRTPGG